MTCGSSATTASQRGAPLASASSNCQRRVCVREPPPTLGVHVVEPVQLACAVAAMEAVLLLGERFWGLQKLKSAGDLARVQALARRRLERADLLARIPPMLGLMATIIPLGPGLAALGQGDPAKLAAAVTVAFDATVLGLVAGIVGLAGDAANPYRS